MYIAIWMCLPGILSIAFGFESLRISLWDSVTKEDWVIAYFLETVAIVVAVFLFPLFKIARIPQSVITEFYVLKWVEYLLIITFVFFTLYFRINDDYLSVNDASLYDERTRFFLIDLVRTLLLSAVICIAITSFPKHLKFWLSFGAILLWMVGELASGSRIAVLLPVFVLAANQLRFHKITLKTAVRGIVGILILVMVVMPVLENVQVQRSKGVLVDITSYEGSYISLEARFEQYAHSLFSKFDSFSAGSVLVNSPNGGLGQAGLSPYIGSILIFIPRALWANRPVAGSIDGTIWGTPARRVPELVNIDSLYYNVGVSPLHITMWQFGYGGIPIFISALVSFLLFVNRLLISRNFYRKVLGVMLLGLPSLATLVASPNELLKNVVVTGALILIYRVSISIWLYAPGKSRISHR
ncbi:MAG: hypothetical protein H6963_13385 [Chromatiaceae bacterium]|nr:hypothetical protein [Chromatiaceae bacterium]